MFRLENATTHYDIDDYYVSFETDLPGGSYKMNDVIGDGGMVSGSGNLKSRTAKITRVFTRENESERDEFISWFTKAPYEEIYLRKTTTSFDGIQRVYPMLSGGEGFGTRNFNYSKEISFEMLMPDPYFESTAATSSTFTLTSTSLHSTSISISGQRIFPSFLFIPTGACNLLDVKTADGFGFHIEYNFQAGSSVVISTTGSDIYCEVEGERIGGYFSANSKPFDLYTGTNNLYITGSSGTLTLTYYGRRL